MRSTYLLFIAMLALPLSAQIGTIRTVAGIGVQGVEGDGVPATAVRFREPSALATDPAGNVYVADRSAHVVREVDSATGLISTVAGTGAQGDSGDGGPAIAADLDGPGALVADAAGDLYIASGSKIRTVDGATGVITTVAGTGSWGCSGDGGPAIAAQISGAQGMAIDSGGNLYFSDTFCRAIRRIDAGTGIITTYAGNGGRGTTGDGGPATDAEIGSPSGLAVDSADNLYLSSGGRIRKVDPVTGTITTLAALGSGGGILALDNTGDLLTAAPGTDNPYGAIARVSTTNGAVTTIAGTGEAGPSGDGGPALSATFNGIGGLAVDSAGNIYCLEAGNYVVRRIDAATGIISTYAGISSAGYSGDGGTASAAHLRSPAAATTDSRGNLFLGSWQAPVIGLGNFVVRRVDADTGRISTFAGNGSPGDSGDGGPATDAELWCPYGLAVDVPGNLFIADWNLTRARRMDWETGIIDAINAPDLGYSGDGGPAIDAELQWPAGVAVDHAGNLFISDWGNGVIRRIDAVTGIITTVAGDATLAGSYSGDGGPALSAGMVAPAGLAVDDFGNLYIQDSYSSAVRKVDSSTGIITTIAGNGSNSWGYSGDGGPATAATLSFSYWSGIAVDAAGNLFIADEGNHVIRRVDAATGIITTVAGTGTWGFSGDGGPATAARLANPLDVAVDLSGNLLIADSQNHVIRMVEGIAVPGSPPSAPSYSAPSNGSLIGRTGTTLEWDAVPGVFYYDVYLDRGSQPFTRVMANTREPSLDVSGLELGQRYSWKVVAKNLYGSSLSSSPAWSFDVPAQLTSSTNTVFLISRGQDTSEQMSIDSMPSGAPFSVSNNAAWLTVTPSSGVTPATLTFTTAVAGLASGKHHDTVTISSPVADNTLSIAVQLDIRQPALVSFGSLDLDLQPPSPNGPILRGTFTLTTTPSGIDFTASSGGINGPNAAAKRNASETGLERRRAAGDFSISPTTGRTPAEVEVSIDTSGFAPGSYSGTVNVSIPGGEPSTGVVSVSFDVPVPAGPEELGVTRGTMTFSVPGGEPTSVRQVLVNNLGTGAVEYEVTTEGEEWLEVSPTSGTTDEFGEAPLGLVIDLEGYPPGTYSDVITVYSPTTGATETIPIRVAVSGEGDAVLFSHSSLLFETVAGTSAPPSQQISVIAQGSATLNWDITATTTSGGDWLSVSQPTGSASPSIPTPPVDVRVNPAGLSPAVYYGLLELRSETAANSPQLATVVLAVRPAGAIVGPYVSPDGLLFLGEVGGSNPPEQTVSVTNVSDRVITFNTGGFADGERRWFGYHPSSGTIRPGETATIAVQAVVQNLGLPSLKRGVYRGRLTIGFPELEVSRTINLVFVVAPAGSLSAAVINQGGKTEAPQQRAAAEACRANQLVPVFTRLGSNFQVLAHWPVPVEVKVVDDCGQKFTLGSVAASFSTNDPMLFLISNNDGRWTNNWNTRSAKPSVTVTARARSIDTPPVEGLASVTGVILPSEDPPAIATGGIVSAASYESDAPLSPGAFTAIFGQKLATQEGQVTQLPLPGVLGSSTAYIGGFTVPLHYVNVTQINGVLPMEVPLNTTYQLIVQRGDVLSVPEPITIFAAQPAVFTADGSGHGQGSIIAVAADGSGAIADASNPAQRGQVAVIFAAGLGSTDPIVPAGQPAPSDPLARITGEITVTIGGKEAAISYAGLAPNFAGLYQLNVIVPEDAAVGGQVEVLVKVGNQTSPTVTMAIR